MPKPRKPKPTSKKVLKYISANRIGVLSLMMPDGSIDSAALHYAHTENPLHFLCMTSKETRKYKAFESPAVPATLVIGFDEKEMKTFQAEGTAIVVTDEANLAEVKDTYFKKFPNSGKYVDEQTIFIAFTPTTQKLSNFKTDPPSIILH
jgi:general stress protein 26